MARGVLWASAMMGNWHNFDAWHSEPWTRYLRRVTFGIAFVAGCGGAASSPDPDLGDAGGELGDAGREGEAGGEEESGKNVDGSRNDADRDGDEPVETPDGRGADAPPDMGGPNPRRACPPDGSRCPALLPTIPASATLVCESPAACPACVPEAHRSCSDPGLPCAYVGTNLYFECTCMDVRDLPGQPEVAPDSGPVLEFWCKG